MTGSGSGIGAACARRFTAEGAKVVVTDLDAAKVEAVAAEIGAVGLAGDIGAAETVRAVAELARRSYGEIDVWFSNAGLTGPARPGDPKPDADWEQAFRVHVMAHLHAVREVAPAMVARGDGYLLSTASVVAMTTDARNATYSVSKHAALALAEWLAVTYRPQGVKVSCFCPGPMLTPMLLTEGFPADHPALARALTPERVADLLVGAIDAEDFLILDSPMGRDELCAKLTDYDAWIDRTAARFATPAGDRATDTGGGRIARV
ncbi:SDR family oxidoreductase [Nocardia sp. BMG111209]|uniref:SDR family NAD(P)-dependent oxidoreductase n=1 Tax=Nocardia sp. BMG111209 TaxID=1160137 RepID=UPI001E62E0BA|nr:SDR family oxidoreductase [Nocardia sp. BMG111209]